jgi:hypothetical protein
LNSTQKSIQTSKATSQKKLRLDKTTNLINQLSAVQSRNKERLNHFNATYAPGQF